jgi:hypothetical protein
VSIKFIEEWYSSGKSVSQSNFMIFFPKLFVILWLFNVLKWICLRSKSSENSSTVI